mmetsp:Transcript_30145/g.60494  ORF Transcript_30145/g.60494 Transcript_30145/m.60494 type:complete len:229 (+) Transcript_30145:1387-2073(+)
MAEVMTDASELLPEAAHDHRTEHVRADRPAAEREVEGGTEEHREPCCMLRVESHVRLKEPSTQELLPNTPKVSDVWPDDDLTLCHLANEHRGQHRLVDAGGVVISENIGAVLARQVEDRPDAARVLFHEARHIIHSLVNDHPSIVMHAMLCYLFQSELLKLVVGGRRGGGGCGGGGTGGVDWWKEAQLSRIVSHTAGGWGHTFHSRVPAFRRPPRVDRRDGAHAAVLT